MNYYKEVETNMIYAYESDLFVKPGLIPITEEEADAILNPPPTPEQLQQRAEYEKQYQMGLAKEKMAVWRYAVELQMATEEEQALLTAWKKYCVLLNRVDCATAPDITWPEPPK